MAYEPQIERERTALLEQFESRRALLIEQAAHLYRWLLASLVTMNSGGIALALSSSESEKLDNSVNWFALSIVCVLLGAFSQLIRLQRDIEEKDEIIAQLTTHGEYQADSSMHIRSKRMAIFASIFYLLSGLFFSIGLINGMGIIQR